jgi:hypothetical protein
MFQEISNHLGSMYNDTSFALQNTNVASSNYFEIHR